MENQLERRYMTNTREFKAMMIRKGFNSAKLADAIKMCRPSLSYKINNKREFTASEIDAISTVMGLNLEEKELIFFCKQG